MLITVLKSKIAYAKVTHCELFYTGSITIDATIMEQANIYPHERVQVVNLNNGERLETYVITGEPDSGIFALNGPAARKAAIGDQIFILSYAQLDRKVESLDPIVINLQEEQS